MYSLSTLSSSLLASLENSLIFITKRAFRTVSQILLLVAVGVLCVAPVAFAQFGAGNNAGAGNDLGTGPAGGISITLPNPLECTGAPAGTPPILCVLEKIFIVLFNISIPITSIMVLVGAFQILTAAGDPAKFATGRKTILYAVVGFAIIFFASSVVPILRDIFSR